MSAALLCFELNHIFLFTAVSVTLSALHVWVLLCVQTRSLIPGLSSFPALSGRQLLSLQWSCIHAPCDSLHSHSPIGQLFHSRERQNGEGSASRQRGLAVLFTRCPTRASFDWKIIIKKKKNNMSLFLFMSRISPDKACSAQPLLFIHRTDASGPPALWMLSHTHL